MRKTTKLAILLAVLAALCLTVFLLSRRQTISPPPSVPMRTARAKGPLLSPSSRS